RYWGEADMPRLPAPCRSGANDPQETLAESKFRSAVISCRTEVCAILSVRTAGGASGVCDLGAGDRAGGVTMILRRSVILAFASIPLLARGAFSQTAVKARRVGLLSSGAPLTDNSDVVVGLTAGFSKRGYVVGRSLVYERRKAEAHPERLPRLV